MKVSATAACIEGNLRSCHVVGATGLQADSGPEKFVAHRLGSELGEIQTEGNTVARGDSPDGHSSILPQAAKRVPALQISILLLASTRL